MSVPIDVAKLEAAGFTVERVGGGAKINGVFVRMHEDSLVLAPERSAFHRQINAALGRDNPKMPGS